MSELNKTQNTLSSYAKIIRRQCELSFEHFVREAGPRIVAGGNFVWGKHISVVCRHLQAVADGRIDKLLMNIPPGCTKSTLLSVLWPPWIWTRRPEASFMCISYHADLTTRDAVESKELINSEWYQSNWGHKVQVKFGSNAKEYYELTSGGWRLSTTRRGRGTGDHPDYIIIDDPLSAEMAKKESERNAFAKYQTDTLSTRGITKKVKQVIGMQRLHIDDPSEHCIKQNKEADELGEPRPWVHLCLPMRYDPAFKMRDIGYGGDWRTTEGELLYPELLSEDQVRKLERTLGRLNVAAQLGQKPLIRDGDFFELHKIRILRDVEIPSRFDMVVRFWDRAGTVEDDSAFTAGALVGRKADRFILLDMIRAKLRSGAVENLIEQTCFLDEQIYGKDRLTTCFEIEPGSGGVRMAEITIARLRGHRVFGVKAVDSKETHAEPLSIAIENGEVCAREGAYLPPVLEEMGGFPSAKFKDQTDAFAGAYLELVNPTSKVSRTVLSSDAPSSASIMAQSSQHGKCQHKACNRPAFQPNGYCCDCCRLAESEGNTTVRHSPECSVAYNDWFIKHSKE